MKIISEEQKELIDAITAEGLAGNLSAFILEKDIHVTDALHALAKLQHRHIRFVFCGGTSLSKAHGLMERMSEDVDLKVVLDAGHGLTQSGMKTHLGRLKNAAIDVMTALGFQIIEEEQRALNANRYFASGWSYKTRYTAHTSLRPHLSLEFTVRAPSFAVAQKPIGYLIDRLANRAGAPVGMPCVAVEETLAEKFCRCCVVTRSTVRVCGKSGIRHWCVTFTTLTASSARTRHSSIERRLTSKTVLSTIAQSFIITQRLSTIRSNP